MSLPTDAKERKGVPLYSGVMKYFPDALAEVAIVSKAGNDQHNPGEPLHWAKEKSKDHHDCAARHLLESGTVDTDGMRHSAKLAWRALALLQIEIEEERRMANLRQATQATIGTNVPNRLDYSYTGLPVTIGGCIVDATNKK